MNAVNAPKLMNDVEVATSRNSAPRPISPQSTMLKIGVANRSDSRPKKPLGSTPSRPIANSSRETLAWAASPEVNWPMIRPPTKNAANSEPPMVLAVSAASESALSNVDPGSTSVSA